MARKKRIPSISSRPTTRLGESAEFLRKEGQTVSRGRELASLNRQAFREEVKQASARAQKTTTKLAKEIAKGKSRPRPPISRLARKAAAARKSLGMTQEVSDLGRIKKAKPIASIGKSLAEKVIKSQEKNLARLGEKVAKQGISKIIRPTLYRKVLGSAGKSIAGKVLSKAAGRIVAPVALASDVYTIGKAVHEGYKAYQAGKEAKERYEKAKTWKPGKRTPYRRSF